MDIMRCLPVVPYVVYVLPNSGLTLMWSIAICPRELNTSYLLQQADTTVSGHVLSAEFAVSACESLALSGL
jgi:hypothetical protein